MILRMQNGASLLVTAIFILLFLSGCGEPPTIQQSKGGAGTNTTASLSRLAAMPIVTPEIRPELTTDALQAARARLPKEAPEEAEIVGKITPGKRGGRLVYAITSDIKSFNPVIQDSAADQEAQGLMFAGLYGYDSYEQHDSPGIAKSWEYEKPIRTWTFHLRKGLKWSDGAPLTADDFIFFTQVIFDPKVVNDQHFFLRQEAKLDSPPYQFSAPDPVTLKVQIPSDDAFSLQNLGLMRPLPRHALETAWKAGKFSEMWLQNVDPKDLVVSGPFKLKSLRPSEAMVFERNPYYYRYDTQGTQLPYVDELVLQNVPDSQAMHVKFLAGDTDLQEGIEPRLLPQFLDQAELKKFTVYPLGGSLNINHYYFNLNRGGTYTEGGKIITRTGHTRVYWLLGILITVIIFVFILLGSPKMRPLKFILVGVAIAMWLAIVFVIGFAPSSNKNGKQQVWQPTRRDEQPPAALNNFKPFVEPKKLGWFSNPEFRLACSEATNRQRMIDTVLFGLGDPLYGLVAPGNKEWFNPDAPTYPYNPVSARARLDKLGWLDKDGDGIREDAQGHPIRFTILTARENNTRTQILELLKEDLRAVGLGVDTQLLQFNNLITKMKETFDFDAVSLGLATGVPPHPSMAGNTWRSSGDTHLGYPNQKAPMTDWEAQLDTLYEQMKRTFDVAEQQRIYFEMQRIFNEQQPAIHLFTAKAFVAAKNKIGNLKPTIIRVSATHNIDELYIK